MNNLSHLLVAVGAIVLISNQNLVDARATNGMSMPTPSIPIPNFKIGGGVPGLGNNGNAGAGGGARAGGSPGAGGGMGGGTGGGMGGSTRDGTGGGTGGGTGSGMGFGVQLPIPSFNIGG